MKQEHKVESLNNCNNELQQQAYAQRLELEEAHHGYIESRQEHVRLQEELVMKEEALRETQIRSVHEMEQVKRAQELRVDEFSVQTLRESHETVQRLASQVQDLQERMNYLNDSGEPREVGQKQVPDSGSVEGALHRGETIQRPVVKRLWINRRASED